MIGCLTAGVTGLNANNTNMSVIANNIANVNTTGYKGQRATFADIFNYQSGDLDIGNGVDIVDVSSNQNQGTFENTETVTDLAIDGKGFFIVKGDSGTFYTRAGQFHFNEEGKLVNNQGHVVQGWDTQNNGTLARQPSDITISNISLPPRATETINLSLNLDSSDEVITDNFDVNNAAKTSNYSTSVSVYDSLGEKHNTTFYFKKQSPSEQNQWAVYAESDGVAGASPVTTLSFDSKGALSNQNLPVVLNFDFDNNANTTETVNLNFGVGTAVTTQFANDFVTKSYTQDGYEPGELLNVSINKEGKIQGLFTNGHTKDLALIALADFNNPEGLNKLGNNFAASNQQSGPPIINPPGTGGKGAINSYTLEGSNVDMATEFMKMIVAQRAFQANARSITVADQLLTEIVSLKR